MPSHSMGWHYTLSVRCTVLPEFLEFYEKEYLSLYGKQLKDGGMGCGYEVNEEDAVNEGEDVGSALYTSLPKAYKDLLITWNALQIGSLFYKYSVKGNQFECKLRKKVPWHEGDLWGDLLDFVKDILVPTTSEITFCKIASDDYGDREQLYTDLELRGGSLYLRNLVRSIEHTWVDGAISETRVVYKRGIPASQQIDLERLYT